MKKTLTMLTAALLLAACGKEALQSNQLTYAGDWKPKEESTDHQLEITIKPDGTGTYAESKPGFSKTASGNVYFKSAREFTIGGKLFHFKIHIDKFPYRIVDTIKPYKYHYEATFNGVEMRRTDL